MIEILRREMLREWSERIFRQLSPKIKMKQEPWTVEEEVTCDKELRVGIDAQLQQLKQLPHTRERALAVTKLQEAIMWLGMDLKRLKEPNPYPNSYDPSNTIVDKTADNLKL